MHWGDEDGVENPSRASAASNNGAKSVRRQAKLGMSSAGEVTQLLQ
jgi:hypothetical protein